jgi:tetratricopeptide (TPR) repeat protein
VTRVGQSSAEHSSTMSGGLPAKPGHNGLRKSDCKALLQVATLACTLFPLLYPDCLFAGAKGRVEGMATNASKSPIPGATLTLSGATGFRQSGVTDPAGHYTFAAVEPGTYTLSAELAGYQVATQTAVKVTSGASTTVNFQLLPKTSMATAQSVATVQPSFYDDSPLVASAVTTTIDSAGYSSQAENPQRLMSEGPSLGAEAHGIPSRTPGSPDAVRMELSLQQSLRDDPESFAANHRLGEFYLSTGNFKAGTPYLEKAKTLQPEDYANGYDLAVAFLEEKRPLAAQLVLQEMLRRRDAAEVHNLLGATDDALGDAAAATKEYHLAAVMDPSEKNLFDEGNELLAQNDIEPAIEVFQHGIARYADSQRMYVRLGIAYYSRNRYEEAIDALCQASDLQPADPRPYMFLAKMYSVSAANAGEIVTRMKRFAETSPANPFAYFYYALSAWKGARGDPQRPINQGDIETLLRKSISLDPRFADAHLQLGTLLYDQRRYEEAIAEFNAAIQLKPGDPDAHYHLAQTYLRAGDEERGQEELRLYEKLHK